MDGYEVCQELRKNQEYIPIIIVSSRGQKTDKIVGLEIGADDYLSKPLSDGRELLARVRAVLRLATSHTRDTDVSRQFVVDDRLWMDLDGRCVYVKDQVVTLTPKEFDLLVFLAKQPGRVFGREMLIEKVWGYDYLGESRTVDVHIQRLRKKIERDPDHPRYILTARTIGYKFAKQPG
jgi:two-component system alkaline phosphatase synthesis response regulator PhoP